MMKLDKEPLTIWDGVIFAAMALVIGGIFYLNYTLGDYSVTVAIFRNKNNVCVTGNGRVGKINSGVDKQGRKKVVMLVSFVSKGTKEKISITKENSILLHHILSESIATLPVSIGDNIAFRGFITLDPPNSPLHIVSRTSRIKKGERNDDDGWLKLGGKLYPPKLK